jgi:hypothetical protein
MVAAVALSAAVSLAAAAEKEVATIARLTGNALVNKGAQYVNGTEGMALSVGERVMSLEETTAIIQFKDGCRYTMKENEVITIPSLSPCVLTKGPTDRLGVLPPVPPSEIPVVPVVAAPAANLAWVPLAAAGLIGGTAIVFDPGDDDDDTPPSPVSP